MPIRNALKGLYVGQIIAQKNTVSVEAKTFYQLLRSEVTSHVIHSDLDTFSINCHVSLGLIDLIGWGSYVRSSIKGSLIYEALSQAGLSNARLTQDSKCYLSLILLRLDRSWHLIIIHVMFHRQLAHLRIYLTL